MKKEDVLSDVDYVDDKVKSIVEKAVASVAIPSEANKNHVSVEGVGVDYSYSFYNPHNARFYFLFDRFGFKPTVGFETINGRELCLRCYGGCRVVVKKRMIEIVNTVDSKRRFRIDGSEDNRARQVIDANAVLEREAVEVLRSFVREFGGVSDFRCVRVWIPDNKILHDRLVDSLPVDLRFRNDVVKKVYNDVPLNVEYSSPVSASNAFRNLGLMAYSPEIASRLDGIDGKYSHIVDVLDRYAVNIEKHLLVQDKTLEVMDAIKDSLRSSTGDTVVDVPVVLSPKLHSAPQESSLSGDDELITQPSSSSNEGSSSVHAPLSRECGGFASLHGSTSPLFPATLSREDNKVYRLAKAKKLREEWGW